MPAALLSVIIPTYNSAKTLEACIDSLLSQSFKDFQILIIDGASEDKTVEIAEHYSGLHPTVSYISEKDKGVYDAMNKGIKLAKSEWLYFLGSDDQLYTNDVFETIFSSLFLNFDVIYGDVYSEMLGGIYDGEFTTEKIFDKNICHQAIFLKKKVFSLTGLFDARFKAHADWEHNLKWLRNPSIQSIYVNKVIAHFGAGGLSSAHKDVLFENVMNWERIKYQKKRISRLNRLRMIKACLKNAVAISSKSLFFSVIADVPNFLV